MTRTFISPKYISAGDTESINSEEIWEVAVYSTGQNVDLNVGTNTYLFNTTGQTGNTNYDSNRHYYITSNGNTSIGSNTEDLTITGWKRNIQGMSPVLEEYTNSTGVQVPSGEVWHVNLFGDRTVINDGNGNQYGIVAPMGHQANEHHTPGLYTFGEGTILKSNFDPCVAMGWSESPNTLF